MAESMITLKTIGELILDEQKNIHSYWIPSYQRGYRWAPLQVTQLLQDIHDFSERRNPQPDEFYCLQPLVIKAQGDQYEVVDGQQRLTTIFLILRHFNERLTEKYRKTLFNLNYETRPKLATFLENPSQELANTLPDYFHLFNAMKAIETWFEDKDSLVETISPILLNKTKVIWFQLSDQENPVDAFTRLNVGKIPLTNDELIRALFLRKADLISKESEAKQLAVAHEWDQLEKTLQKDPFWYFLNNQVGIKPNRIGYLFEKIVHSEPDSVFIGNDSYRIFHHYNKKLKDDDGTKANEEWSKIRQLFMMLEEWYSDRTLYHIVGFLIVQGKSIIDLRRLSLNSTKSNFDHKLRSEIFKLITTEKLLTELSYDQVLNEVSECLDGLSYKPDSQKIPLILLLFNIATLLSDPNSNLLFQFDNYKKEVWDIEHIRSLSTITYERYHHRVEWLKQPLSYFKTQEDQVEIQLEIEEFINTQSQTNQDAVFNSLYTRILSIFKESDTDEADNGIFNLTLLDSSTNRSYKNAVFAIKRQKILAHDRSGIFVPICTRNVFLKSYSPNVDNLMFWGKVDRDAYREVMIKTLVDFFTKSRSAW